MKLPVLIALLLAGAASAPAQTWHRSRLRGMMKHLLVAAFVLSCPMLDGTWKDLHTVSTLQACELAYDVLTSTPNGRAAFQRCRCEERLEKK